MGEHIADRVIKLMTREAINAVGAKALVLGLAFKENCPDIRNTKVTDLVAALLGYHIEVDVYDPWVDPCDVHAELSMVKEPVQDTYDVIIVAVAHDQFVALGADGIKAFGKQNHVLFDVKNCLPPGAATDRL